MKNKTIRDWHPLIHLLALVTTSSLAWAYRYKLIEFLSLPPQGILHIIGILSAALLTLLCGLAVVVSTRALTDRILDSKPFKGR